MHVYISECYYKIIKFVKDNRCYIQRGYNFQILVQGQRFLSARDLTGYIGPNT